MCVNLETKTYSVADIYIYYRLLTSDIMRNYWKLTITSTGIVLRYSGKSVNV
jgi:hypothetical protein